MFKGNIVLSRNFILQYSSILVAMAFLLSVHPTKTFVQSHLSAFHLLRKAKLSVETSRYFSMASHNDMDDSFVAKEDLFRESMHAKPIEFTCEDGIKIAGKSWGHASGKPVLALHGWLDNAASFDALAPDLSQVGCHVVALDFPGHGLSSHRSIDATYNICDYPYYVLEAANHLGWEKFSLVGHSMGAVVSSMVAGAMPELVEKCVLIEGIGPLSYNAEQAAGHLRKNLRSRELFTRRYKDRKKKAYGSIEAAVEARIKTVESLPGNQFLSREAARIMVQRAVQPAEDNTSLHPPGREYSLEELQDKEVSFIHDLRLNMASPSYFTEDQAVSFVQSIRCPTLLIMATKGWPYDTERYENRKSVLTEKIGIDTFNQNIFEGGHHLHLDPETAQQVSSRVLNFFQCQHSSL